MNANIKLYSHRQKKTFEVSIKAYKTDNSHLVVHKTSWIQLEGMEVEQGKTWTISHVPTGRVVMDKISKRSTALNIVNNLFARLDWKNVTNKNSNEFYNKNIAYFNLANSIRKSQ